MTRIGIEKFQATDLRVEIRAIGAPEGDPVADVEPSFTLGDDAGGHYQAAATDHEGIFDGEEKTRHQPRRRLG
ncbi:MAG: hypothetical protein JWN86_138 [Planctomycetota bacterium]|nr:hypothetical protein [Planctomycetota bacterium]